MRNPDNLTESLPTARLVYRGIGYTLPVECRCPKCGKLAIVRLPPAILAEQPDDTTYVCLPTIGGCNHGFAID